MPYVVKRKREDTNEIEEVEKFLSREDAQRKAFQLANKWHRAWIEKIGE